MRDNLRAQIYANLIIKDTEDLLEIWQNGDTSEWNENVFEIIQEILIERLGYVPPKSIEYQVLHMLGNVKNNLLNNELDKALSECELVIQMKPDSAIAFNYFGEIYEEMGHLETAITNYQKAVQLEPELKDAWRNLLGIESEMEDEFEGSVAKRNLDQALEYTYDDEPDKALEACEAAKLTLPSIAVAYNYLGLVLQTLDRLELAMDAYLKAITLNPRFYAARENLANARVAWEEVQYHILAQSSADDLPGTSIEFDESQIPESHEPIPQWLYMDEKSFLLTGWPGHRTRDGRSGLDPLEIDFEFARMQGFIFKQLITYKFRTHNPIYLIFMAFVGISYLLFGVLPLTLGNLYGIITGIIYTPYSIVGIALLANVYLSLWLKKPGEYEDYVDPFF